MRFKNVNIELIKKGMTKQDLVQQLNDKGVDVTYQTVCRWLNGKTEITFGNMGKISEILGKSMDYLFCNKDE